MKKQHSGTDYESGCVMAMINVTNWDELTSHFDKDDVYKPEVSRYGIETDPHITILYGFHSNKIDDSEIESIIRSVDGDDIKIDITGIEIFEDNPEFDVVKMTVKSDYLNKLHDELSKLPNSDKYPTYQPHITMAYIKKGRGKKYELSNYKHHIDGIHNIVYSKPDGEKIQWEI